MDKHTHEHIHHVQTDSVTVSSMYYCCNSPKRKGEGVSALLLEGGNACMRHDQCVHASTALDDVCDGPCLSATAIQAIAPSTDLQHC